MSLTAGLGLACHELWKSCWDIIILSAGWEAPYRLPGMLGWMCC